MLTQQSCMVVAGVCTCEHKLEMRKMAARLFCAVVVILCSSTVRVAEG